MTGPRDFLGATGLALVVAAASIWDGIDIAFPDLHQIAAGAGLATYKLLRRSRG